MADVQIPLLEQVEEKLAKCQNYEDYGAMMSHYAPHIFEALRFATGELDRIGRLGSGFTASCMKTDIARDAAKKIRSLEVK